MSSKYYDSSSKTVIDGDVAYASDLNDINTAVDTALQLVDVDITALAANQSYYSTLAQQWAENPEDSQVTVGHYSALHWAAKSEDFQIAASNSAISASSSASTATTQAGLASTAKTNAELAETNAEAAQVLAEAWASNPINVIVADGKYSAYHWAKYAEAEAAVFTPSGVLADLITVDGTGSGLDADLLDGQHGSYYAPLSTVTKSYIGLGNVDNTSDVNKPISSATQSALDSRAFSIDSYAALQALTSIPSTAQAIVAGRLTKGDGGEGTFRWSSSDLSSEVSADTLSGVYVAPNSDATGASGAWIRQFTGAANVKWFGALGNGVANDTTAIQACVTNHTEVFIPSGTYLLEYGIEIPSNRVIKGDGMFSSILKAQDLCLENVSETLVDGAYAGGLLKATSKTNILIEDLGIDGNELNQIGSVVSSNAQFSKCQNVRINKCRSINSMQESLKFAGSTYCSVTNCITEDNQYSGISLSLAQDHLVQTTPDYPSQSDHFTACNNISKNDGTEGASAYSINARYCTIENNSIYRAGLTGITLGHASSGGTYPATDASFSIVSGNIIREPAYVSTTNGSGIYLGYAASGVSVVGNTIDGSLGYGILKPQSTGTEVDDFLIDSNLITDTALSAIAILGASGYTITGNNIKNAGQITVASGDVAGIYIGPDAIAVESHNSLVSNNTITNTGTSGLTGTAVGHGIYLTSCGYIFIKNNSIIDDRTGSSVKMTKGITASNTTFCISIIENICLADSHYMNGSGVTITLDATAKTITRNTGSFITDGFVSGRSVSALGFTNPQNNATYIVSNVAATVLTYTSANTTPVNETATASAVSLYTSYTTVAAPYITSDGFNPTLRSNRISPYPMSYFFYLTNNATGHILSNPNILSSLKTYVKLEPASSGAPVRAQGMYQNTWPVGSQTYQTIASGVTGDRFFYEVI